MAYRADGLNDIYDNDLTIKKICTANEFRGDGSQLTNLPAGGTVTHASTTGQTATDHHDNSNDHAPGSDDQDISGIGTNATAIGLNTTHRGSAGTDHSDVGLANTHRGLTNEHLDWTADLGATNVNAAN